MDAAAVAHGIHYAIVAVGVVGILALLLPMHLPAPKARAPRDLHEARVMLLRAEIARGAYASTSTMGAVHEVEALEPEPELPYAERVLLPAAFVASTAAAGVHAAMAPTHFTHSTLFGAFFLVTALVQISWSSGLVLGGSRLLLLAGAVVNSGLIGLWAVTRTLGLPVLLPDPEPVGPWDLTCVAWQVVVVVACLRLLGSAGAPTRLAPWHRWDDRIVLFSVGSVAALAALSVSGFHG